MFTRELAIACGNSCQAKRWVNRKIDYKDLLEKMKTTMRTPETTAEYKTFTKEEKQRAKDHGGFVAGTLKGTRRLANEVESRSCIALDGDHVPRELIDGFESRIPFEAFMYTTHSSTPDAPRARIIIPSMRDMTPDEFNAISRYIASEIGMEWFDPVSFRPNQLMYWPSTPSDGEYVFKEAYGDWLDPDRYLAGHPGWKDPIYLPCSPRETKAGRPGAAAVQDPLTKDGIVGFFNRAYYPISKALEKFLPDVYEPTDREDRWHLVESDSLPGVEIKDDGKFVYSHHAKDPACMKLCNAFDIVRIHRFGDEKGSFDQMCSFAMTLPEVKAEALRSRQAEASADFSGEDAEDWQQHLEYDRKTGKVKNTLRNVRLILENDSNLKGIVFNQLADGMEIVGEVPWKHPARFWRDADDAQLINYIDDRYGTFSQSNYMLAVQKVADDRSYHPIRRYFDSLPAWDGIPRAETYFIDYLGTADNRYTRAVTRKTLCAAYERIQHPGIKFDYCIVLNGPQGIGKSTAVAMLGMQWYSDSLSLSDMNDKTAAEKLQGYWILEIGELAGMRKADVDKVKAFISRQDDKYRASFGRRVSPHPRQNVFIGTTNSEDGYLRDVTGNRRFWNVRVTGKSDKHPWEITQDVIDQIWAEVKETADGEKLYLPPDLSELAEKEQNDALEHDDREGLVADYLDTLLPDNWNEMDVYDRLDYIRDAGDPTKRKGVILRETVSNMEIWVECFGRQKADMQRSDSYAITAIMMHFDDWEKTGKYMSSGIYGRQRVWQRKHGRKP
jgi:putative DNA primase/helicase